jgi:hypothetical protein
VALLTGAGVAGNVADLVCDRIVELRAWRNDGIASLDQVRDEIQFTQAALSMTMAVTTPEDADLDANETLLGALDQWNAIAAELSTDYPAAEDF